MKIYIMIIVVLVSIETFAQNCSEIKIDYYNEFRSLEVVDYFMDSLQRTEDVLLMADHHSYSMFQKIERGEKQLTYRIERNKHHAFLVNDHQLLFDFDGDGETEMINFNAYSGSFELYASGEPLEDGYIPILRKPIGTTRSAEVMDFGVFGNKIYYYTEEGEIGLYAFENNSWNNYFYSIKKNKYHYPLIITDKNEDDFPEFYCMDMAGNLKVIDFADGKPKAYRIKYQELEYGEVDGQFWDAKIITDYDNDGQQELLYSKNNQVIAVEFNEKGVTDKKVIIEDTVEIHDIIELNLDKDQDKEIIIGSSSFKIFDKNETGEYQLVNVLPPNDVPNFYIGDLNNDGSQDLLISGIYNHLIYNNQIDSFVELPNPSYKDNAILIDLSGDGLKDLLFFDGTIQDAFWLDHASGFKEINNSTFEMLPLIYKEFWSK